MYLAVGDTSLSDSLNLLDMTNYLVVAGTFDPDSIHMTRKDVNVLKDVPAKQELVQADGLRRIRMELQISGSTSDVLMTNIRAIYKKQRQARDAGGAAGIGAGVCLWYKYGQASNYVYYDVVNMLAQPKDNSGGLDGLHYGMTLDLYCLPNPHGDAITDTVTGTIVNGVPGAYYRAAIPGDVDAVCQVLLSDVSTSGKVINRVRLARRSLASMGSSDFVPVLDAAILGSATSVADAACIGGARANLVMAAGAGWANHAKIVPGSAIDNRGLFDVWARVRDSETIATPGTKPTVTTSSAGGTLQGGFYQYAVVGVDSTGVETLPNPLGSANVQKPSFVDGFESNTFAPNWATLKSGNGGTGSTLAIAAPAAFAGTYGMSLTLGTGAGPNYAVAQTKFAMPATNIVACQVEFQAHVGNTNVPVIVMMISGANGVAQQLLYIEQSIMAGTNYSLTAKLTNRDGTTATVGAFTGSTLAANWYRLELVYDITGLSPVASYYVNGSLIGQATDSTNGTAVTPATFIIGAYSTASWISGAVNYYDNVAISNALIGALNMAAQNVLAWTPGASVSNHHIYWNNNGGPWSYIATGSALGSYTHTRNTGGTPQNPPVTSPYGVQLRMAGFIAGSGQQPVFSAPTQTLLALGSSWHHLYLGTLQLPPTAGQEGQNAPLWELDIQSRPATATNAPTCDIDAVWLLPADEPQLVAEVPGLALATSMIWREDTRRDGRSSVVLEQPAGTVQGNLAVTGQFTIGPGDSFVVAMVDVAGGVSDVVDAKYTMTLRIIPRYAFLRGNV